MSIPIWIQYNERNRAETPQPTSQYLFYFPTSVESTWSSLCSHQSLHHLWICCLCHLFFFLQVGFYTYPFCTEVWSSAKNSHGFSELNFITDLRVCNSPEVLLFFILLFSYPSPWIGKVDTVGQCPDFYKCVAISLSKCWVYYAWTNSSMVSLCYLPLRIPAQSTNFKWEMKKWLSR